MQWACLLDLYRLARHRLCVYQRGIACYLDSGRLHTGETRGRHPDRGTLPRRRAPARRGEAFGRRAWPWPCHPHRSAAGPLRESQAMKIGKSLSFAPLFLIFGGEPATAFDCTKAQSPVEKAICADAKLKSAD